MLKSVKTRHTDALSQITWQDFEVRLKDHYRNEGYRVEHVGTGSGRSRYDGGIDLKLRKDDEYILVQCKHWNARQVPHNAVHELLGIMVNESATGAVVVTSGEFTKAAIRAATRHGHVNLIDGNEVRSMLGIPRPAELSLLRSFAAQLLIVAMLIAGFSVVVAGVHHLLMRHIGYVPAPQVVTPPIQPVTLGSPQQPAVVVKTIPAPVTVKPTAVIEPAMTGEALREWQRKNEQSMKILEKTTPELGQEPAKKGE